jgi:hypothetical protein
VFLSALRAPAGNKQAVLQQEARLGEPVPVHLGPAKKLANGAEPKGSKAKGAIAATAVGGTELASRSDDGSAVPLPRPRPKIVRAIAAPTAASSTATTAQTTAAHAAPRPAVAKTDTKTDAKTDAKKK